MVRVPELRKDREKSRCAGRMDGLCFTFGLIEGRGKEKSYRKKDD